MTIDTLSLPHFYDLSRSYLDAEASLTLFDHFSHFYFFFLYGELRRLIRELVLFSVSMIVEGLAGTPFGRGCRFPQEASICLSISSLNTLDMPVPKVTWRTTALGARPIFKRTWAMSDCSQSFSSSLSPSTM